MRSGFEADVRALRLLGGRFAAAADAVPARAAALARDGALPDRALREGDEALRWFRDAGADVEWFVPPPLP